MSKLRTIAFYNVENLFDTSNNPYVNDDDFTPNGKFRWTRGKYLDHLNKIARVISKIGKDKRQSTPDIIGLAEVENKKVLEDLIQTPALQSYDYGFIHYNSPDKRGVDVALLYKKSVFTPYAHQTHRLELFNESNEQIFTRDQLSVSGFLDGEEIHFIVNHWPSRREGKEKTQYRREAAARLNKQIIEEFRSKNPLAKVISMGDFNDNALDSSFKKVLKTQGKRYKVRPNSLYNPMETMYRQGMGTLVFDNKWDLFDQIYVTGALIYAKSNTYSFLQAYVFNPPYLLYKKGISQGFPKRSIIHSRYIGGFSDHLPVYLFLKKKDDAV